MTGNGRKRLQDALAREQQPVSDPYHKENEAIAYFERVVIPAFEAAAATINEQETASATNREPSRRAVVMPSVSDPTGMHVDLEVREGGYPYFWFRGRMRARSRPVEWTYRRNPRITGKGTFTSDGTDKQLIWKVSTESTPEQITDDLLDRYAAVVEARTQARG